MKTYLRYATAHKKLEKQEMIKLTVINACIIYMNTFVFFNIFFPQSYFM